MVGNCELWNHPRFDVPRGDFVWAYVFRFPFLFELRVEKHWLTHCTEIEPGVAGRIAEIEHWMDHHCGHVRFDRLKGHSQHRWRGRDERQRCAAEQARREMRACLGVSGNATAEHIPSTQPCGGHGGWDVFSRFVSGEAVANRETFFCGSEAGDTSPPTIRQEDGILTGYRHFGQGSQALASRGGSSRVDPRGASPRRPDAPAAIRRRRLPVRSSSKRAGSTPAGFLRKKTTRVRSHGVPANFSYSKFRGSEIGVTSWQNGHAADQQSADCGFDSRRDVGQPSFNIPGQFSPRTNFCVVRV